MGGRVEDGRVGEWKKGRREGWKRDGRMFYNLSESRRARNGVEKSTIKDECATGMVLGIAKLLIIGRF